MSVYGVMSVLGYGITPKLSIFGVLPYHHKSLEFTSSGSTLKRSNKGFSDATLFGRYIFYQKDGAGTTFRTAGFAGVKIPLFGDSKRDTAGELPVVLQQSTGSWDGFLGVVTSYQTLDFEIDGQVQYRKNGSFNGTDFGDELRLDASFQHKLLTLGGSVNMPGFLYGVIGINGTKKNRNITFGSKDDNSGGKTLFLSPGIQYATKRYILEAALQIPVYQNLNGTGLENDYVLRVGFRFNF